ncbi:MAG: hypothetical protein QOG63_2722 [Thermoleophilaceae bacterium]|nr:hypothetical protein [Thermoleophilaceae bacterium]
MVADGLVVDDECTVRLVRAREDAGEDASALLVDAIEIGARVLDREQAGANADFVRGELEKVTRETEAALGERTREFNDLIARKVDEAFGAETGVVSKALQRHFSDDSSAAVQNRVRQVVTEAMTQVQQSIVRQFSSADAQNPLAEFKQGVVRSVHQAAVQQGQSLRGLDERMAMLQQEVAALRTERDKLAEIEAERDRGTAKGRTFEEEVAEALDRLAVARGDDCEAVGDLKGSTGRVGDVVVGIEGCSGPPRGRIVFEAKNSKLSRRAALDELDKSLRDRDADFAVLVVPSEDKVPAKMRALREYNGDKMIVTLDPEGVGELSLELAYSLARARVLMQRSEAEGIDASAVRDTVERALNAMESVRAVKSTLTGAQSGIEKAKATLDTIAAQVREHLEHVNELVAAPEPDDGEPAEPTQASLV